MEYMKIDGFFGAAISNVVNKAITNKTGVNSNVTIEQLNIATNEEEDSVEVSFKANMSKSAFQKLLMEVTK